MLDAKIPVGPGYQVSFAEQVKQATGITTGAIGLIADAQQAEQILVDGKVDFVALARAMLSDPRRPWCAAVALGGAIDFPPQYAPSSPEKWSPAAGNFR